MFGRKSVAAVPARAEQTTRILVVGAVGLDADLCVAWTDPVPNVADFDVAVVLVPSLEIATQVHRDSFYEYQQRFKQLLESDGELYVFADPRESWSEDDRPKIYGTFDNYDWCPIWLTVENSSGTTVVSVDPEFTWYYRNVDRWDLVISHPAHEGDNRRTIDGREHAVLYEWEMLAQNRAKQALSTRVRYSFHLLGYDNRTLASVIRPEPTATAGWAYFIGRAHPWLPDRAAQELLAHRWGRAGSVPLPAWLTSNLYPPTSELDLRIAKASDEANRLRSVVADLERERNERRSIVGLLYESGQRLEDLVAAALDELGAALGQAIANEEFTALYGGIVAAVEVKGNAKSASQDDLRALADYLTGHDLTDDYAGSRGVLVVNAWRNLPLDDRGDWFPDNVAKAAVTGGRISLVRSIDLYRAVVDLRAGNAGPSTSFMDRVFSESGRIRY